MRIAVLALQGAFEEHRQMLEKLGVETFLIRNADDWRKPKDGLVIPGGESTAMMKIMGDGQLLEPIRSEICAGLPTFGTCAGMILLDDQHLGCMDITVKRNAYGRQLGSFHTVHEVKDMGEIPMTFIRAPYVERCGDGVEVMSTLDDHIVAVRQGKMLACAFHPELTADMRMHEYFVGMVKGLPRTV